MTDFPSAVEDRLDRNRALILDPFASPAQLRAAIRSTNFLLRATLDDDEEVDEETDDDALEPLPLRYELEVLAAVFEEEALRGAGPGESPEDFVAYSLLMERTARALRAAMDLVPDEEAGQ